MSEALSSRVAEYIAQRAGAVTPFSVEEYFIAILDKAVYANEAGDYGIGAALVLRVGGVEVVSLGWSTMLTKHDPLGHAETNAITRLRRFLSGRQSDRIHQAAYWRDLPSILGSGKKIYLRPATAGPAAQLFTSLEPCPMCTVAIMNAGIERVVVAVPDEPAGALGPGRLGKLPPLWPALAKEQRLQVEFTTSEAGQNVAAHLPFDLATLLHQAFWSTKEGVDKRLVTGTLIGPNELANLPELLERLS